MSRTYKYQTEEVKKAYLKYKSHIYYDTTELFQRKQVAIFETGMDEKNLWKFPTIYNNDFGSLNPLSFEDKFKVIANAINCFDTDPQFFNFFIDQIGLIFLPKKLSNDFGEKTHPVNFLTNKREKKEYSLEKVSVRIDMPIELHIISVLWVMQYGYKLDKTLCDECVGNRLLLTKDKDGIIDGTALFKPYFKQYQKWRDGVVEEAQNRLSKGEDVAILNLDIKEYFYSVRFDFNQIESLIQIDVNDNLHKIFKIIHNNFTQKLIKQKILSVERLKEFADSVILPIGMASSYILGNWYLNEFDKRVKQKIRPVYYSRYVDDISIVLTSPDMSFHAKEKSYEIKFDFETYVNKEKAKGELISFDFSDLNIVEVFILETLNPILKLVDYPAWINDGKVSPPTKTIFKLTNLPDCFIQNDKTLLYLFNANESCAAIDKLKLELDERSSEFRDFPEDDESSSSFAENAYHLIFDGSEGKVRTLKDYKENRYGLSVFLANKIFTSLRRVKKVDKIESEKLLKLFKGQNTIEYYTLWEKIFTYFLVNNDKEGFISFYEHTFDQIEKVSYVNNVFEIKSSLFKYFYIAAELSLSLNPKFLNPGSKSTKKFEIINNKNKAIRVLLYDLPENSPNDEFYITRFRRCNLIRHNYVLSPLLNYTIAGIDWDISLLDHHLPKGIKVDRLEWNPYALDYSPRKVKFWECCIAVSTLHITKDNPNDFSDDGRYVKSSLLGNENKDFYLNEAFDLYDRINRSHSPKSLLSEDERKKQIFDLKKFNHCKVAFDPPISINEIGVNTYNYFNKNPKISFANIKLYDKCFIDSLRGEPQLNPSRYSTFSKLLKDSRKAGADIFLLPECSIPHSYVSSLAKYSAQNQILIVAGLEHWRVRNISYNFIVTIIPTEIDGEKDAVVVYRLKNHYSHHEELEVRGNEAIVPKPSIYRYDLFNWKGLYFAPYYCVELADITHRSLFRSKVDLIIASEWNQDTNYFSSIVESLSRDLHVYVAQVNNSVYGDSRLTQPTKTEKKDIIKLKGGDNDTILVGQMDISLLREFQRKLYELTKDDKSFKPVPPDFNRLSVNKRIKNEKHY